VAQRGPIPLAADLRADPAVPTFRDLDVWRNSVTLTGSCYRATTAFPRSELCGLVSQIRRASVSVASNIAEGHCRRSTRAFLNHVRIALGSNGELSTLLELAHRLGFLSASHSRELESLNETMGRQLYGLYRALEQRSKV
jgi:four helix bundle protein